VIVKDGVRLGSGWHRAAGQPHAEREALADAFHRHGPDAVRGATIYVTLEPCSTHGRTPPCTQGLIDAGVARVVYACVDRNPAIAGRADAILTRRDRVASGVLASEAEKMLRPFFKVRETGLPWVIWKTAMSLDGRLTRPPGEGQWLTGEAARADVQQLRATVDAILTSGETVRRDRPALTLRVPDRCWKAARSRGAWCFPIIRKRCRGTRRLFTDANRDRTLLRPRHDPRKPCAPRREQGVLTVHDRGRRRLLRGALRGRAGR
jgi:diaminohydroxyphosphoribosylaminopyrimidine deaminase / 5-amino-6-(5-phosphoribosylamino)uracil reductase